MTREEIEKLLREHGEALENGGGEAFEILNKYSLDEILQIIEHLDVFEDDPNDQAGYANDR